MDPRRIPYGDGRSQWGELHLPDPSTPRPARGTVVVVHGGFWRARYDASLGDPLARDLAARGLPAWNLEYRRVGHLTGGGGGFPATLDDVAAGVDRLAAPDLAGVDGVEPDRVVVVGHSAGGHLATWAAARHRLPAGAPGAGPAVRPVGAVSQAGVVDLARGYRADLGDGAVAAFLGGGPDDVPDRYSVADPAALLPLGVPVRCVHARDDVTVPLDQSTGFVAAATAAGDDATLSEFAGDHSTVVDPAGPAWEATVALVLDLLRD